jgi:hypothetical protein
MYKNIKRTLIFCSRATLSLMWKLGRSQSSYYGLEKKNGSVWTEQEETRNTTLIYRYLFSPDRL